MIIFPSGITITTTEQKCLLHIVPDPESWLLSITTEKARLRRAALIKEWRPRLFADDSVTELPADAHALCELIMARSDYKTRLQQSAALTPPESTAKGNVAKHAAVDRSGTTATLFASGMDVTDVDVNCILAYVQALDDWVIGALMGQINRGKKKMLAQYHPVILADPDVATMPATEEGLINMIVARSDYRAA
jgi:hypothetical protein